MELNRTNNWPSGPWPTPRQDLSKLFETLEAAIIGHESMPKSSILVSRYFAPNAAATIVTPKEQFMGVTPEVWAAIEAQVAAMGGEPTRDSLMFGAGGVPVVFLDPQESDDGLAAFNRLNNAHDIMVRLMRAGWMPHQATVAP